MSDQKKMFRGTFLLTAATFTTQILGMLYLIPFYSIMGGEENLALYGYAYTPYTIMLSVAAAGVPGAVSKFVAKYNALGAYETSQKLYKSSLVVMMVSGILAFLALYFMAPVIAEAQSAAGGGGEHRWSTEDITSIIRVISFAVIVVPFMATWRGIFQGHESFGPTSVSSVVEQILRIAVLLSGAFIVINVMDGSIKNANEIAVFAAFIGAVGATVTLAVFWRKRKPFMAEQRKQDTSGIDLSYGEMYKEIIRYGLPFIIVSVSIPVVLFIDQMTHNNALTLAGVPGSVQDSWFGMLNLTTHKLVMIPTAFASAFAITILPFITKNYQQKLFDNVHSQVKSMILMLLFFVIPAGIGMMILSAPIYTSFYSYNEVGIMILTFYAPVSIIISLFSVTCSIVQGIDKQHLTFYVVIVMLVIKAAINIPLIMNFYTVGAVMGTAIALGAGVIMNLIIIKKHGKIRFRAFVAPIFQIIVCALAMLLAVELVYYLLMINIDKMTTASSVLTLLITVPAGVLVYLFISFKTGLADEVLGDRAGKIRQRVKFL
ncbi:polysaccharide biosynthesis protein [Jeotgalicoccus halotolerans]|uniref:O-antigen/teichoic acid export membrane protein n=1 Tax=Jeotgalicoccus halotolerans TaxID=157227 RepID=A0A3E0B2M0_9STAP|nr:polysaccharide biosynthesis protein [Jeotgalicoccus halotolerans]REG25382.1 O-antigen/teichoic acid export membrane protein [Jeotgalicoccus halotolerans]